jgi:hypothetical protein
MKSFTEIATGALLSIAGFGYCISLCIIFLFLPMVLFLVLKGAHR